MGCLSSKIAIVTTTIVLILYAIVLEGVAIIYLRNYPVIIGLLSCLSLLLIIQSLLCIKTLYVDAFWNTSKCFKQFNYLSILTTLLTIAICCIVPQSLLSITSKVILGIVGAMVGFFVGILSAILSSHPLSMLKKEQSIQHDDSVLQRYKYPVANKARIEKDIVKERLEGTTAMTLMFDELKKPIAGSIDIPNSQQGHYPIDTQEHSSDDLIQRL